jgi:hypothetical protein
MEASARKIWKMRHGVAEPMVETLSQISYT